MPDTAAREIKSRTVDPQRRRHSEMYRWHETLLIQRASSGVGLMGMQIGKVMGAALVMGTSTNAARRVRLKEFGCDLALDSRDPKWPDEVKKATGGKGVDLIVDMVSAPVANQNLAGNCDDLAALA